MDEPPRPHPSPESFLLEPRRERVDGVVAARTRSVVVVLDRLGDSFNQAAVLRTCEGMGVQEVHVVKHPVAGFQTHTGVTQGCEKWLDIVLHETPQACAETLKAKGYALWVSSVDPGSEPLARLRFDGRMALVFGNERTGVHEDLAVLADGKFWIPMRGFSQSFNVSVAVAMTVSRALLWREEHLGKVGDLPVEEREALQERFYRLSIKQWKRIGRSGP